jgi:hypothetical protein
MGRRVRIALILAGMLCLLAGCLSQSGEDFYVLPQLPEDYLALQQTIKQVMDTLGAEYAAPTSGSNVQNIQLQDLDGDGVQESAVAFFRVPGGEKPLKIYIFRQDPETEEYETAWIVEGDGSAIYSVAFEDLGGGEAKEMVVSWQISTGVQSLSAYFLQNGGDAVELMRSGYTKSAVVDLDRDNEKEIVLVQLDAAEDNSRAELYKYDNGLMTLTSTAPLSVDLTDVQGVKVGCLTNQVPALFVSSNFGEGGGRITDILAIRDGELANLTLDESSGMSVQTVRYYKDFQDVNGLDINSDGILELPIPKPLALLEETGTQTYVLHWNQYDLQGEAQRVCTTYHCYDDGWYLITPESWQNQVTVARRSSVTVSERAVSFYYWPPGSEEPQEFLTIYRLTGSSRTSRATIDDRFLLLEGSNVVYAAKFQDTQWDCGLNGDELRERFNLIRVDWSSDN